MPSFSSLSRTQRLSILDSFKSGLDPNDLKANVNVEFKLLEAWYAQYQAGDFTWAGITDEDYKDRREAYMLFSQGVGYKKAARLLQLNQTKMKYWLKVFRSGNTDFFKRGRYAAEKYSPELKKTIREAVKSGKETKKSISERLHIPLCTISKWTRDD